MPVRKIIHILTESLHKHNANKHAHTHVHKKQHKHTTNIHET